MTLATRLPAGVLMPAEWVRRRATLHGSIYLPALGIGVLWIVAFIWAAAFGLWLVSLLAAVIVCASVPVLVLWAYLRRRTSVLLLTDQRLVAVEGPFPRRIHAVSLADIDQVHVRQGRALLGLRLAAAATLYATVLSSGKTAPLEMHDLGDAEAFAADVLAAARARR